MAAEMDNVNDSQALGRIEGKLDVLSFQMHGHELVKADHEKRLRRIEAWMYSIPPTLLLTIVNAVLVMRGL